MANKIKGVWAAALTPINNDGNIDIKVFTKHVKWLLNNGCHGVVIFGTTGEAPSFTIRERMDALDHLLEQGILPAQIVVGSGFCAYEDTFRLTVHATDRDCAGVLVIPPFFFKGISDEGIYRFYAKLIQDVGSNIGLYLYHFPDMSGIAISHDVIKRLNDEFPQQLLGVKDSTGDFANMQAMAEKFPKLSIMSGDDHLLLPLLRAGGSGSITATVNLIPHLLRQVYDGFENNQPQDEEVLTHIENVWEKTLLQYPVTEGLKAYLAKHTNHQAWQNLRLPLVELPAKDLDNLFGALNHFGLSLLDNQKY